jgi:hypothetical protein
LVVLADQIGGRDALVGFISDLRALYIVSLYNNLRLPLWGFILRQIAVDNLGCVTDGVATICLQYKISCQNTVLKNGERYRVTRVVLTCTSLLGDSPNVPRTELSLASTNAVM